MSITVFHLSRDLNRDERLSVTNPEISDWQERMDNGTYLQDVSEARIAAARALFAANKYFEAATVETDDLEVAFRLTNSIDNFWSLEPDSRVTPAGLGYREIFGKRYGYKSSEVGDIFRNDATGETFVCDTFGFAPIPAALTTE
jgi:hypothetical protein